MSFQCEHNEENFFEIRVFGLFGAVIRPKKIDDAFTEEFFKPFVDLVNHVKNIIVNDFKIITVNFIVLNAEEFLDDLVGLELAEIKSFGSAMEKVVLVVNFDFVDEEFSGFVGQVRVAVMFIDFEGSP